MSLAMVLTGGRIVLAPVFFLFFQLAVAGPGWLLLPLWIVLLLIELSDLFDGVAARAFGKESEIGKILDPCADSISRLTYFLCLGSIGLMPLWVLLVLVYRDVGVAYIRVMISRSKVLMPARTSGKVKAWIYAVAGIGGVAVFTLGRLGVGAGSEPMVRTFLTILFVLCAAVAAWSLLDYFVFFRKNFRRAS